MCSAKMSGISTTIKVFEPMDTISKGKKKPAIGRMFQGGQDTLKPFKVCINHCFVEPRTEPFRNSMYPQNRRR